MRKTHLSLCMVVLLLVATGLEGAENIPITKANYELPARFTPNKMKKLVFSTYVDAHWLKHSDRFWYIFETCEGKSFVIVDPAKKQKLPIFDNIRIAALLTEMTKDPYDAKHLPIETIKFIKNDKFIYFKVLKNKDVLEAEKRKEQQEKKKEKQDKKEEEKQEKQEKDIKKETEKEKEKEKEKSAVEKAKEESRKYHHFEYELATRKLTLLEDYVDEPERPRWASISPDGNIIVFGRHHNLYYMDKENYEKWLNNPDDETIKENQLTTDGEEYYSYHDREGRGETNVDKEKNKDKRKPARIIWSHDSKKFAMIRNDSRKVKDLWVINSIANPRPTLETYKYHMPGEKEAPQAEILIFDLEKKDKLKVNAERFKDQTLYIMTARYPVNTRDDDYRAPLWLSETPDKLYFSRTSRDLKRIDVCSADTATGEVTNLIEERLNTYVEIRRLGFIANGKELVHWSERDGWAHFYLYDGEGNLKKPLTSGPFHCEDIVGIDENARVLYFLANGREEGEDPYYLHLYRVNLDGTGLQLLNKDNFNHRVFMNDSNLYFVDNFSRVDTAPQAILRDNRGNPLMELGTTDLSALQEAGFQFPETFKVKADDGITDLYGVMFKPYHFDENKKYPIIAYVYPGPQTESVDKSFSTRGDRTWRLAQFGFIVVTVGNRGGHPSRSKWYHNYGYGNLRDYGLADKKATIEQLAARHPYIDLEKVGIFGHSGGGFMSTAALLVYPDFFKVAVSSAGNHENNIYNRWWSEKHHGVREVVDEEGNITFEYDIDKNSEVAKNLKGRLLIVTGDIDNNVHPANTIRLAHALIKANKRFDFFLFPGQRHGFGDMDEYFFWLRADYFCKHLIGDYSQDVDIEELNREMEMTGEKKK
ncbi:MAG: DPP IV N-terminal domain-containing protein [Candidatus Aminicenantes bacterium]|nr:DPP IV N-terminal domain-containing protein [Candidatus Aminicenantes bacterium]MDH5383557.1 DPP IV N-terminal domain-containing protein [Candidatus Aminicenantes bacterium]